MVNPIKGDKVKIIHNYKFEDFFEEGDEVTIYKIDKKGKMVDLYGITKIKLEEDVYYFDIDGLRSEYFYRDFFEFPIK